MKFSSILKTSAVAAGILFFLGLGIGTSVPMPGYAPVYLDDVSKTYIALPCTTEWESRSSKQIAMLRLGHRQEAVTLHYTPDDNCRNTGAFSGDGHSLSGLLLMKLGLLSPIIYWWDKPYRTETGEVVYPAAGLK